MRYTFELLHPSRDDLDYTAFVLTGDTLAEAIAGADDELPLDCYSLLRVENECGQVAHVVMGDQRTWQFADIAEAID
ncbi:MAG: hypothetical protein HY331_00680 [Chloroflexi bacterium]|nr:hypothetical protein [Chloroflexota bacterium]